VWWGVDGEEITMVMAAVGAIVVVMGGLDRGFWVHVLDLRVEGGFSQGVCGASLILGSGREEA